MITYPLTIAFIVVFAAASGKAPANVPSEIPDLYDGWGRFGPFPSRSFEEMDKEASDALQAALGGHYDYKDKELLLKSDAVVDSVRMAFREKEWATVHVLCDSSSYIESLPLSAHEELHEAVRESLSVKGSDAQKVATLRLSTYLFPSRRTGESILLVLDDLGSQSTAVQFHAIWALSRHGKGFDQCQAKLWQIASNKATADVLRKVAVWSLLHTGVDDHASQLVALVDDKLFSDLIRGFGPVLIGPEAFPCLVRLIADSSSPLGLRMFALELVEEIGWQRCVETAMYDPYPALQALRQGGDEDKMVFSRIQSIVGSNEVPDVQDR